MRKLTDRETNLYAARVYVAEAQRRRGTAFAATLLQWAANARQRAAAADRKPVQIEMFGDAA